MSGRLGGAPWLIGPSVQGRPSCVWSVAMGG